LDRILGPGRQESAEARTGELVEEPCPAREERRREDEEVPALAAVRYGDAAKDEQNRYANRYEDGPDKIVGEDEQQGWPFRVAHDIREDPYDENKKDKEKPHASLSS
jgi:hypothetical protein